jgi:hypothetical protein
MGAFLSVINDDFQKEKEFCYIEDYLLNIIVQKSDELSFTCLSYVLGYENTIFNSAQMEEIETELKKLTSLFTDSNNLKILNKIKEAIEFALKDPPSYLLFEGD